MNFVNEINVNSKEIPSFLSLMNLELIELQKELSQNFVIIYFAVVSAFWS